jgi:hypothetical protein
MLAYELISVTQVVSYRYCTFKAQQEELDQIRYMTWDYMNE